MSGINLSGNVALSGVPYPQPTQPDSDTAAGAGSSIRVCRKSEAGTRKERRDWTRSGQVRMNALCAKMNGLTTTVGSNRSAYLKGDRSVSAPRLVAANTPAAMGAGRARGRTPLKVVAARVAGVEIPNAKKVEVRLPRQPSPPRSPFPCALRVRGGRGLLFF